MHIAVLCFVLVWLCCISFWFPVINSLAPGTSVYDFKKSIFNLVSLTGICRTSYANTLRGMPQDLTDGKSTLVQVMAWCRQAASHYLNQCWPRSLLPYGVTRPQWVNVSIYFRISSQALGQSYDCPSASEVILKYMGKINQYQIKTKYCVHISWDVLYTCWVWRTWHL